MLKIITVTIFIALLSTSCGGGGGSDDSAPELPAAEATPVASAGRVWTVAELEAESSGNGGFVPAKCGGELGFRRCICAAEVPSMVRYRPAVLECNGNAAAVLGGPLVDAFSIVVRDTQNRDRWPEAGSGYGGCSFATANSESPPNGCSAFKAQSIFLISGGSARVYCFGASGYSSLFADASRLTVKLSDDPFSNDDDIERFCLNGPSLPLN